MDNNELLDDLDHPENPQNVRFAGFWVRVGASMIDFFIVLPIVGLGVFNALQYKSLTLALILIVLQSIYKPLMEFKYGATVGKMATKLKVVSYNFKEITLNQSILRNGFYLLGFFTSLVTNFTLFSNPEFLEITDMIKLSEWQAQQDTDYMSLASSMLLTFSIMFVPADLRKQGLHDKIAQTFCIHK